MRIAGRRELSLGDGRRCVKFGPGRVRYWVITAALLSAPAVGVGLASTVLPAWYAPSDAARGTTLCLEVDPPTEVISGWVLQREQGPHAPAPPRS